VKKKSIVSEPAMHSLPAWQGLQPVTPFDISDRLTDYFLQKKSPV
jgi:hypothetical protein